VPYSFNAKRQTYRVSPLTYARRYDNLLVVEILSIGNGGWVRYQSDDCPVSYLRYLADERGRLLLRECFVDSSEGQPITNDVLGRLPLTKIEAFVNGDGPSWEHLRASVDTVSPVGGPSTGSNVAVLASHYATTFHKQQPANWCALAQQGAQVRKLLARDKDQRAIDADYHLDAPPGPEGLTDEFLHRVARAYGAAIMRGEAPNATIHKDVGFNPTKAPRTVERWVYEARKRQIMRAARKGARG
jgi:hypothetical protein